MFARFARIPVAITKSSATSTLKTDQTTPRFSSNSRPRILRTMATASKVHLSASQQPQFHINGLQPSSAEKASQLLQTNHSQHHIFFNQSGFHVSPDYYYLPVEEYTKLTTPAPRTTSPTTSSPSSPWAPPPQTCKPPTTPMPATSVRQKRSRNPLWTTCTTPPASPRT